MTLSMQNMSGSGSLPAQAASRVHGRTGAGVVRPGCCTSLLYNDAIHKLGMADDGPGMLVTCNRLEEGVTATSTDCA